MEAKKFERSFIEAGEKPRLSKPVLVVGLPGIGLVSKLAADNLVRVLNAKHFATLFSPHFPNQVIALKSGRLRLFGMHFYAAKAGKRDLIVLKGDLQPLTVEGQYEVSAKVLDYASSLDCKLVLAMAGYAINTLPQKPRIYCTSSSKKLLQRLLKLGGSLNGGVVPIVGMAGMLPGLAPLYGMKGACLLVETPGPIADANGAKMLTELLSRFFDAKFDTSHLAKQARKASKLVEQFERQAAKAAQEAMGAPSLETKRDLTYIR